MTARHHTTRRAILGASAVLALAGSERAAAAPALEHPDAALLDLHQRLVRVQADCHAASLQDDDSFGAYMDACPRPPADLLVQNGDIFRFSSCSPSCLGGVWNDERCRALRKEVRHLRETIAEHPEWELLPPALARAEAILAARRAFIRGRNAPHVLAAKARHLAAQEVTSRVADEMDAIEEAIRSTPAKTPARIAVQAYTLAGFYRRERPDQSWADEKTGEFLRGLLRLGGLEEPQ